MIPTLRQMATDELRGAISILKDARTEDDLFEPKGGGLVDCLALAGERLLRREALIAAQSEVRAAYAKGRADERAAVVAYLASRWVAGSIQHGAVAILEGKHVKEEEPSR